MAAKKRKKSGQLSLRIGVNDERIPKMIGVLCLFFALYLFIAFTSYLFTWQTDQDRVLRFSWELLLNGQMEMANWLGRLGAIVSNIFFYWGFGLPSYIFVAALVTIGLALIKRTPSSKYYGTLRTYLLWLLILSVFFEFVTPNADFPWGGAFGAGVSMWMLNFVGTAGLIVLFLFMILGIFVWSFNPNFNEMTPQRAAYEARSYVSDFLSGRVKQREAKKEKIKKKAAALRPGMNYSEEIIAPKVKAKEDLESQLAFDLNEDVKKSKPNPKPKIDTELEIEQPLEDVKKPAASNVNPGPAPDMDQKMRIAEENQNHSEPYDPTLELSSYEHPVLALLPDYCRE